MESPYEILVHCDQFHTKNQKQDHRENVKAILTIAEISTSSKK